MVQFLLKMCLFIPLLATIGAISYFSDPSGLMLEETDSVIREIARHRNAGRMVITKLRSNPSARRRIALCQAAIMKRKTVDVVAIGSSRLGALGPDGLPGYHFVNLSVPGARLQDLIAICEAMVRHKTLPQTIVFGVDEFLLATYGYQTEFVDVTGRDFYAAVTRLGLNLDAYRLKGVGGMEPGADLERPWGPDLARCKELFMPSYFQASLWHLFAEPQEETKPGTAGAESEYEVLESMPQPPRLTPAIVEARAVAGEAKALEHLEAMCCLNVLSQDPDKARLFDAYVADLMRRGVRVVVYLPPVHPVIWQKVNAESDDPLIVANEKLLRQMARRRGFDVIGSYDPGRVGLDRTGFRDEHHLRPAAIDKLFAQTLRFDRRDMHARRATGPLR